MSFFKKIFNSNKVDEEKISLSNSVIKKNDTNYNEEKTTALLNKVRKIEIKTKGLSNHIFSGEYHTAFKGRGMNFSEVRNYNYGDDVRNIDWNVTARFSEPFIKVFEEERELTLMLLIDISSSSLFGTQKMSKRDLMTEMSAVLAFSALNNNDKVGVIFFSDKVEKYIPPKKGKSHILYIIREMLSLEAHNNAKTNIEVALKFMNNVLKKRSIVFLMSDFYSTNFENALQISAKKHDVIGTHIYDKRDAELPNIGLLKIEDAETLQSQWIDTNDSLSLKLYSTQFTTHKKETKNIFSKNGASYFELQTNDDYIKQLHLFFKTR